MVNSDTDYPQDWRLPVGTDMEFLRKELAESMRSGRVVEVKVEVGPPEHPTPTFLLLNPARLASAAVVELPVASPSPYIHSPPPNG